MLVILGLGFGIGALYSVKAETCSVQTTYYRDADDDGYGNPAITVLECSQPSGYVADNTDCNDNNVDLHPGAVEICDFIDNDCDGGVDEGLATSTYYYDFDLDGYGYTATTAIACKAPDHYSATSSDCNDLATATHPFATEICNGVDDNCNGVIDENATSTFYRDADGDGYGNQNVTTQACSAPAGYVADKTDCNDSNASVYPGRSELNNGIDDDCDGSIDEGYDTHTYYRDVDGDGYGVSTNTVTAAAKPAGYASVDSDCNDNNAAIHPNAAETDNNIDDDCDGTIDEGFSATHTYYRDADGDGYGNPSMSTTASSQPSGYVTNSTDCNDSNAAVHPGVTEIDNDIDDDCDGTIDEGFSAPASTCDCGCCFCSCACSGCGTSWNKGAFVSCLAHYTNWLKKTGEITGKMKGQIMSGHASTTFSHVDNDDDDEQDEDDCAQGGKHEDKKKAEAKKSEKKENHGKNKNK